MLAQKDSADNAQLDFSYSRCVYTGVMGAQGKMCSGSKLGQISRRPKGGPERINIIDGYVSDGGVQYTIPDTVEYIPIGTKLSTIQACVTIYLLSSCPRFEFLTSNITAL